MLQLLPDRIIQHGNLWQPGMYRVSTLCDPAGDHLIRVPEGLTSEEEFAWVSGELRQSLSTGKKTHIHGISVGGVRQIFATYYQEMGYYDARAKCYTLFNSSSLPQMGEVPERRRGSVVDRVTPSPSGLPLSGAAYSERPPPLVTFSVRLPHLMYSRADRSRIQSGMPLRETYDASGLRSALNEGMITAIEVRKEDIPLLGEMLKKGLIPLTAVARLTSENWGKLHISGVFHEREIRVIDNN